MSQNNLCRCYYIIKKITGFMKYYIRYLFLMYLNQHKKKEKESA